MTTVETAPATTIILLVKNGERYLAELLAAVYTQRDAGPFEVLAIDSGSQDRSKDILRRYPVRLHEIPPQEFNHGETRNLGARLAHPDSQYLVYLTQDATPANDAWLANLLQPLRESPAVAGVFSRHVPRPHTAPALARQLQTVWQTGGSERLVKSMPADRSAYERTKLYYANFSDTSSAIRRSVWEQVPFRPLPFAEDADWADRALQAGHTIVFEPSSTVVHSHDYPVLEQFRQNVDHTAGMKELFPGSIYHGWESWLRLFAGIPKQVAADWHYTFQVEPFCKSPAKQKLFWLAHSPAWHVASATGTFIGAHLDGLPKGLRRGLSRQERLRTGSI
jgi:rhamnosyltransferase